MTPVSPPPALRPNFKLMYHNPGEGPEHLWTISDLHHGPNTPLDELALYAKAIRTNTTLALVQLNVHPSYCRQGLGSYVLHDIRLLAKTQGWGLEITCPASEAMRSFYRRHGAEMLDHPQKPGHLLVLLPPLGLNPKVASAA
jgi:GNAT superfamily N-acetyltransferase